MTKKYQLKTLTPVHVGSGEKLGHIDGFFADRKWWRVDLDKVLGSLQVNMGKLTVRMGERDFLWPKEVDELKIQSDQYCTYILNCPEAPRETEIREAFKTVFNQPMVPGSSIKGAIRTAILLKMLYDDDNQFEQSLQKLKQSADEQGGRPRSPASIIEKSLAGNSANTDMFRSIHVSDTRGLDPSALEMGIAWTVTPDNNNRLVQKIEQGSEYKIFVEQIKANQTLDFTIKIDQFLFSDMAERDLHFQGPKQQAIESMAEACRQFTEDIIALEIDFYKDFNLPEMENFYRGLANKNQDLSGDSFILPIGWGTGYHAKTVTESLIQEEDDYEELVLKIRRRFRLGQSRSGQGGYDERAFPKTRRVLYDGPRPKSPLGWVEISPAEG